MENMTQLVDTIIEINIRIIRTIHKKPIYFILLVFASGKCLCYNFVIIKDDGKLLMKKAFSKFIFNGTLLGLGIYLIYVLVSQQPVIDVKIKQKAELEKELAIAQRLEIDLKTDISMADSTFYIEKTAKEKLGMLKPGEKVFIDIRK